MLVFICFIFNRVQLVHRRLPKIGASLLQTSAPYASSRDFRPLRALRELNWQRLRPALRCEHLAETASGKAFSGPANFSNLICYYPGMPLVEARSLCKTFRSEPSAFGTSGSHQVQAVKQVSLAIETGETLGLVGESGSGKSTLGRLLLRLIEPDSGEVDFDGHDVLRARGPELRRLRRDMQIVFQDPFGSLDPRMTVEQIVSEPLAVHENGSRTARRVKASEVLRAVGLDESALGRYPHEFSGGQRQRIGIARALILRPRFIVADEPVSALDVSVGAQIVNLLKRLQRDFSLTYLFVSHSLPVVRYLADRIAVMQGGELVEVGTTEQITAAPQHPYTRTLLAATPEIEFCAG